MSSETEVVAYFMQKRGIMAAVRSGQLIKAASKIRDMHPEVPPTAAIKIVLELKKKVLDSKKRTR